MNTVDLLLLHILGYLVDLTIIRVIESSMQGILDKIL